MVKKNRLKKVQAHRQQRRLKKVTWNVPYDVYEYNYVRNSWTKVKGSYGLMPISAVSLDEAKKIAQKQLNAFYSKGDLAVKVHKPVQEVG